MKKTIKKWLGINQINQTLDYHTSNFSILQKHLETDELNKRVEQLERDSVWLAGICNGLLDYLNVDYKVEKVPDLRFIPEQPRLRDEIRIKAKKKK